MDLFDNVRNENYEGSKIIIRDNNNLNEYESLLASCLAVKPFLQNRNVKEKQKQKAKQNLL